jgi:hypothetical protein
MGRLVVAAAGLASLVDWKAGVEADLCLRTVFLLMLNPINSDAGGVGGQILYWLCTLLKLVVPAASLSV